MKKLCVKLVIYKDHTRMNSQQNIKKCYYFLCNNPEECSSHLIHGRSLKSCNCNLLFLFIYSQLFFLQDFFPHSFCSKNIECGGHRNVCSSSCTSMNMPENKTLLYNSQISRLSGKTVKYDFNQRPCECMFCIVNLLKKL